MCTRKPARVLLAMAAALFVVSCDDSTANSNLIGLEVTPSSVSVVPGGTISAAAIVTRAVSVTEPVELSISSVPAGLTVTFVPEAPPSGTFGSRIDVAVAANAALGTYDMTIRAEAPGAEAGTHGFTVVVVEPSGGFTIAPFQTRLQVSSNGSPTTVPLTIVRAPSFTGAVSFRTILVPPGLSVSVTPSSTTGSEATLSVTAVSTTATGPYTFELRASATGQPDVTIPVEVIVTGLAGGLDLDIAPPGLTVTAGGPAATGTVGITRSGSFTGPVDVVVWDQSNVNITAIVTPSLNITGTSTTLSVQAAADVPPGTYEVLLFGANTGTGWAIVQDFLPVPVTVVAGT